MVVCVIEQEEVVVDGLQRRQQRLLIMTPWSNGDDDAMVEW